jgi:hypothetical protein
MRFRFTIRDLLSTILIRQYPTRMNLGKYRDNG